MLPRVHQTLGSPIELEKDNAMLWQKLEAIYDELHELFQDTEGEEDEEE